MLCYSSCYDINLQLQENFFASAHADGSIRIWSVRGGDLIKEIAKAHDQ